MAGRVAAGAGAAAFAPRKLGDAPPLRGKMVWRRTEAAGAEAAGASTGAEGNGAGEEAGAAAGAGADGV